MSDLATSDERYGKNHSQVGSYEFPGPQEKGGVSTGEFPCESWWRGGWRRLVERVVEGWRSGGAEGGVESKPPEKGRGSC